MRIPWKPIGWVMASLVVVAGFLLATGYAYNRYTVGKWLSHPQPPGQMVDIGTHRLYATVKGEGATTVVMFSGGNAFSWGWWPIQDELAKTTRVLTYDRSGYGWSENNPEPYSSKLIVSELHALLAALGIGPPYVVVGASVGGAYAKHFAQLYPDQVNGALFVDPSVLSDMELRDPQKQKAAAEAAERTSHNEIVAAFGGFRLYGPYLLRGYRIPAPQISLTVEALSNPAQHRQFQRHWVSLLNVDGNHYRNAPRVFPAVPVTVLVQDNEVTIRDAIRVGEIENDEQEKRMRAYLQAA